MLSMATNLTMKTLSFLFCKLFKFGFGEFCSSLPFWNLLYKSTESQQGDVEEVIRQLIQIVARILQGRPETAF